MKEKKIIVDGEIINIDDGKIDQQITGTLMQKEEDLEDTIEINPIEIKNAFEDTIYDMSALGGIDE